MPLPRLLSRRNGGETGKRLAPKPPPYRSTKHTPESLFLSMLSEEQLAEYGNVHKTRSGLPYRRVPVQSINGLTWWVAIIELPTGTIAKTLYPTGVMLCLESLGAADPYVTAVAMISRIETEAPSQGWLRRNCQVMGPL